MILNDFFTYKYLFFKNELERQNTTHTIHILSKLEILNAILNYFAIQKTTFDNFVYVFLNAWGLNLFILVLIGCTLNILEFGEG
jgi:hypothetical protein